jgi:hypothetical protein
LSGARNYLQKVDSRALGDRGYDTDRAVLAPMDNRDIEYWNSQQYHFRVVVENVFANVKNFKAAKNTFKQYVTLQSYAPNYL